MVNPKRALSSTSCQNPEPARPYAHAGRQAGTIIGGRPSGGARRRPA